MHILEIIGSKFIFWVLYVDDILPASNDLGLPHESLPKKILGKVLGRHLLRWPLRFIRIGQVEQTRLCQKAYIVCLLRGFTIHKCSSKC